MRRVVVTGMGTVNPIGLNVDEYWEGLKAGKTGFGEITYFDTTDFKVKVAAEVKGFVAADRMDKKAARRMEPFAQYAVAAAKEAFEDAGLDMEKENPYRVGCAIGSGVGSLQSIEREHKKLLEKGPSRINPLLVPLMITNMATGNVTIQLGIKGKSINVVTACATGTHSIGEAFRSIQYGEADVMLAGGTENAITPIGVGGFTALTALSTSNNPERCSIPFDKDRDGFVIGDGAGVVVLEELEHAKGKRCKNSLQRLLVMAQPVMHIILHHRQRMEKEQKIAMLFALKDANVAPEEITYINAHGTSTHHNDLFETRAIKAAFGEHAYDIKVNSTKSMIGHLLGAAGAVEFIACVLQMNHGYVHQTVGLEQPDEELDLDYVQGHGVDMDFEYALTNSLAFGGHNASLLIKKYTE